MSQAAGNFRLSRAFLVILVLVAFVASIAAFAWAAIATEPWNIVASGLASAFLSVAVATLATEVILRPVFTREVIELANLRHRLHDIGLQDLVPETEVPWTRVFAAGSPLDIVVARPAYWIQAHLEQVLLAAGQRQVALTFYLPSPETQAASRTGETLGIDGDLYESEVRRGAEDIEDAWKRARTAGALHANSTISIEYVQVPLSNGIVRCHNSYAVSILGVVPERTSTDLVALIECESSTNVSKWLQRKSASVEDAKSPAPVFTDRPPSSDLTARRSE